MFVMMVLALLGFAHVDQCVVGHDAEGFSTYNVEAWEDGKTRWNPDPAKRCE